MKEVANLPVFECSEITLLGGTKAWRFYCPHCKKKHTHGAMEGHRVAHCTDGPYRDNGGYYLIAKGEAVRFNFKITA